MNMIIGLHKDDGQWVTKDQEVENVAADYFTDIFTSISPSKFDNFLQSPDNYY